MTLKASLSGTIHNQVREIDTNNVVAKIEGSDPALRNEYVIYSGHWDHMGTSGREHLPRRQRQRLRHGGRSGIGARVQRTAEADEAHRRVPLATAEERGLLGAKYYVQHPLYPLAKTVANINLDYFSNWGWGRTKDFSILGMG